MSTAFPRSARVRASADYARVFEQARRTSDPLMSLHWLPGDGAARLGQVALDERADQTLHRLTPGRGRDLV